MTIKANYLSWKDYKSHVYSSFRNLQFNEDFADVTLVSDDQVPMKAHKMILSSFSPVLKDLFLINPHPHTILCTLEKRV